MSELENQPVFRSFEFDKPARTLLRSQNLPVSDLPGEQITFYELLHEKKRVAIGATQFLEKEGLLRSVAVDPKAQNRGYGSKLVKRLMDVAREESLQELYLLTTTAEGFFEKFGFCTLNRDQTPTSIRSTEEFRSLCSESAVLMAKQLEHEE